MPRLLTVTVYEGVDLAEHREPYVMVELLDISGRPIKHERARTKVAPYGPSVVWTSDGSTSRGEIGAFDEEKGDLSRLINRGVELTLGHRHDLRNIGGLPTLRITVWGHERIAKERPLGVALLDLAEVPEDGSLMSDWMELQPDTSMAPDTPCGRLRVDVRLDAAEASRIVSSSVIETGDEVENYVVGIEEGPGDQNPEFADLEPNLLMVHVRRARGLIALDPNLTGDATSDPYVKLMCDGIEHRTKVIERSLDPEWDEKFEFAVKEHSRRLSVEVVDYDMVLHDTIGSFTFKLEHLLHRKRVTRWFQLLDNEDRFDKERPLGELELSIQWINDPRAKELATKRMTLLEIVQRTLGWYDYTSDTDDLEDGRWKDDVESEARGRGARGIGKGVDLIKAELEKKKLEQELMNIEATLPGKWSQELLGSLSKFPVLVYFFSHNGCRPHSCTSTFHFFQSNLPTHLYSLQVKSGDYSIYVHIIEVRDLKAEDFQGTSDPVVYVEAFGQKLATVVKQACLSCVFDETFVISLRNLDKEEFEQGVIRVSVMDADGPAALKNDLIGSYSFDAANVYFHKDHEMHRQWVALVDDENPKDNGTQGYLQLSIAIVGPGDKLKVHDEAEDRRREREAEAKAGGIDGLVMVPPSVKTKTEWLVTTVWKAEYLPVMDNNPLGRPGGDYYTKVSISGGHPAESKPKSVHGNRSAMNPEWRTQLWVPTSIPAMSGLVRTTVMDWDITKEDEMVGCVNAKLKDLEKLPRRRHAPQWYPLYGAPLKVPTSTEMQEMTRRLTDRNTTDWKTLYMTLPNKGSTYRGRILMSREIRESLPAGKEKSTPWRRKVRGLPRKKEPATCHYAMRCYVAVGSVLPQAASVVRMGRNFHMAVRISIGGEYLETRLVDNEGGVCQWGELLQSGEAMTMPSDPEQMPDVIIHLLRGMVDLLPICFFRIPAKELLGKGFDNIRPRWILLNEDKVLDSLPKGQYPGSLLIKLGLGKLQDFERSAADWHAEALRLRHCSPYLLRVHVYQGRDLPAADSNGLMDPYLTLRCGGQELNTETYKHLGKAIHRRRKTVDPMWYFTWEADLSLPSDDLQGYFPQVSVQLTDYDAYGADDYAGCLFLDLSSCPIDRDQNNIPPPPRPTWREFFLEKPGDSSGELLVSYQLIKTSELGLLLKPPPVLAPAVRPAYLEVLAIGVRGMQPFHMLPIQMPYMEIEIDLPGGQKGSLTTEASKKPTGADANFLQRLKIPVELPVEEIFAPRLKLRVRDTRLGGFLTPVVAVGAVDLSNKLPWAVDYEPPASVQVGVMDIMQATGAPVFDDMFAEEDNEEEEDPGPTEAGVLRSPVLTPGAATLGSSTVGNAGAATPPTQVTTPAVNGGSAAAGVMGVIHGDVKFGGTTRPGVGAGSGNASARDESKRSAPSVQASSVASQSTLAALVATREKRVKIAPEIEMVEAMGQEDDGAGVFGAVLHEPEVREKMQAEAKAVRKTDGYDEDDEGPPKYMLGRATASAELERDLGTTPFETYNLYRGQKFGGDEGEGGYRVVGKFKSIIRVTVTDPDDEPLFAPGDKKRNEEILMELLKPKGYMLRLYVLEALNLTPMDLGIGGRPGKSDPYLSVKLGKETFTDRDSFIPDVTDADFFKCIEVTCELPGASQLQIDVMDRDEIGSDDLIGRTVIDIEDRWFDQRWQVMGIPNRVESPPENMRWQTKPVENRSLYVPTSNATQGVLRCWVDIMSLGDAKGFEADDVSLPPPDEFEVRLVIWKCKDVVSADFLSGLNDLFVKAWIEGCEPQVTDTHWRARGGKGSFNWRIKFKVELGPRTRTMKFPYLTLQMWDKDILKWNDCIAEGMIDLGKAFRKAYKRKQTLKLFESALTEKGKKALMKAQRALKDEQAAALRTELETGVANTLLGPPPLEALEPPESPDAEIGLPAQDEEGKEDPRSAPRSSGCCCFCRGEQPMTALELREENDRRRAMGVALLDPDAVLTKNEARKKQREERDEETREMVHQIKLLTGLSNDDPPDSKWIKMEKTNRQSGKVEPMGQCLIGIQILPMDKAQVQPAGHGRTEPNNDPFLPPPTGRLSFTWNPISMLYQLLGPRLCRWLCCCLCVAIIVLSIIFLDPLWNIVITLALR